MLKTPYRVGITEKYIKEVIVFAEDSASAAEQAEALCNDAVIEIGYDNFVSRDTETYGPAHLPLDMQIFDAYGERKHICDVQKGDVLIHEGQLYTAAHDSFLSGTDRGEEWTVQLEGKDPDLFIYASYFPEGMVDVAQSALQHEKEMPDPTPNLPLSETEISTPRPYTEQAPRATLSTLIQAARDQLEQHAPDENIHYDISDTLITYGDANGGVNNLTLCITNPVGTDPMTYNDKTVMTSGTDGKDAVMKRHEDKLHTLNLLRKTPAHGRDGEDPLPEV